MARWMSRWVDRWIEVAGLMIVASWCLVWLDCPMRPHAVMRGRTFLKVGHRGMAKCFYSSLDRRTAHELDELACNQSNVVTMNKHSILSIR